MPRTTNTYLDALCAKLRTNDSGVARALGVCRQTVSKYRNRGFCMDDDVAKRAAELLGIQPGTVLLDMYIERSTNPDIKSIWQQIGTVFQTTSPDQEMVTA